MNNLKEFKIKTFQILGMNLEFYSNFVPPNWAVIRMWNAEAQNEWSYTPSPPYAFVVWTGTIFIHISDIIVDRRETRPNR
jgi:hypothetical protein